MKRFQITPDQYMNWLLDAAYCPEFKDRTLRFGQMFCNDWKIKDPDLFCESNVNKCVDMIIERYVSNKEII